MFSKPLFISSTSATSAYTIDQSIRFNQVDNASMSRTPSSASNKRTWTFSWWWKRGNLSGSTNGTNQRQIIFGTSAFSILSNHNSTQIDGINVTYTGSANDVQTLAKFRDTSAWYNFQAVLDTTHNVASERFRLYKNGQRITSFASITNPAKDTEYTINNTQAHYIGLRNSGENLDGYLSEIVFIDGLALEPSSFGEENDDGIWIPKDVSGLTFGTNGFWIDGRDSGDLGDDESGNGNDFTASGLAAHDQVADSPTNSFAVINSVYSTRTTSGAGSTHTIEDGNLYQQADSYSTSNYGTRPFTVQPLNRGKWYFEFEGNTEAGGGNAVHVAISEEGAFYVAQGAQSTNRYGLYLESGSAMYILYPGSARQETNAPIAQYTKIIGCAIDFDNAKMYFFVDGAEIHGQDISAGTAATNLSGWSTSSNWIIQFATLTASDNSARSNMMFNFGQEGTFSGTQSAGGNSDGNGIGNFKHSVPSGYLALCTKNLGS